MTTNLLTQKELAGRWGVCLRSVQRRVREFDLRPVEFTGNMPVFAEPDVIKLERERLKARMVAMGFSPEGPDRGIISVAEAKALAGKGGRK
jgi:hypothetical protein